MEVPPLATAGVTPPASIVARFAAYFPSHTPLSYILNQLCKISRIHPRFHVCNLTEQILIANCIQPFDLTITDRTNFIAAPAALRDEGMVTVIKAFARCVASQSGGELLDIPEVNLELLDQPGDGKEYLRKLEALYKALTLYLSLSYRFSGVFISQALGFHVKKLVEDKIDQCLEVVNLSPGEKSYVKFLRQRTIASELKQQAGLRDVTEERGVAEVHLPTSWEDEDHQEPLLDMPDEDIDLDFGHAKEEVAAHAQGKA